MQLANRTKYAAQRTIAMDGTGKEMLVVVAKATYDVSGAAPRWAEKPEPIRRADEYHGEPDKTSIKHAADVVPFKPATDVLLFGHAYPAKPGATEVDVSLKLGTINKVARVFGERQWGKAMGVSYPSKPKAFDKIPLKYELAYGGTDLSNPQAPEGWPTNPVGVGFRSKQTKLPTDGTPVANLENPGELILIASDHREPRCFGPIAPFWQPRAKFAGTYDEKWLNEVAPLMPADFNEQFFQAAPPDQVLKEYIKGGEPVEVLGATPSGKLAFELPKGRPDVVIRIGDDHVPMECVCDTVVIDTDKMLLTMTWRGRMDVHNRVEDLLWAIIKE